MSCTKLAEPIEVMNGLSMQVSLKNHVLGHGLYNCYGGHTWACPGLSENSIIIVICKAATAMSALAAVNVASCYHCHHYDIMEQYVAMQTARCML